MTRVEGANEVAAAFMKAARLAPLKADAAVEKYAKAIEETASQNAPRGPTGDLASSIEVEKAGRGSREVGSDVRYAPFVEYGTYKDAPQPFFWPAVSEHAPEFTRDMEQIGEDV